MKASTGLSNVSKTRRQREPQSGTEPRIGVFSPCFLADSMLGRLARWLRIVGFDTWYFRKISDQDLLSLQENSGRILLTRDTGLIRCSGTGPYLFITHDRWEAQLCQVLTSMSLVLSPEMMFTRCIRCNRVLEPLTQKEIKGKVPEYVASTQTVFRGCSSCGKIYWPGSHRTHVMRALEKLCSEIGIEKDREKQRNG